MEIILKIESLIDAAHAIKFLQSYVDQAKAETLTVDDMGLTVRTLQCLKAENIHFVSELLCQREIDLLKTPNLGRKSLNEIVQKLSDLNLHLAR